MNLLEEIRATEIPGKRGGDFFYARVVHSYFDEIEKLKSEGFSLATICNFLEKKGVLPPDSDPYSFRRAFRRKLARKSKISKEEGIKPKEKVPKHEPKIPVVSTQPTQSKNVRAGTQINPDNTFNITPVDPDDLPDIN